MEELLKFLQEGQWVKFKEAAEKENHADVAQLLHQLEGEELLKAFRLLSKDTAVDVFAYLDSDAQLHIIKAASASEVSEIVNELFVDDAVDFLEELPATVVKRVLANANSETRAQINKLLNYEQDSAGSIMTTEFVDFKASYTVEQAIERIKTVGVDSETIYTCYVIDTQRHLLGTVALRRLILEKPTVLISTIMREKSVFARTSDKQEDVANNFRKYDLMAMPVVDSESRLVGIITIDDVLDVIEDENTEDFQKMAAMIPSDQPYLKTSPIVLARNRIIWLFVLMISATISGAIIEKYNYILSSYVVIASFIPMLMDTGGNSGAQASTLIIRGMALGEIKLKDIFKVQFKEFKVGLIAGLALSLANFLRLVFLSKTGVPLALVVSISLMITVVIAKFLGATLPILAKACKVDPAIMAGPLITTIADAFALIIYFNLAIRIMHIG